MSGKENKKNENPTKRKLYVENECPSEENQTENEASSSADNDERQKSPAITPVKTSQRKRRREIQTTTPTKLQPLKRTRHKAKQRSPNKKRRVSFSTVDLHEFEQRIGPESHGVPDEGAASLFMGNLIQSSPQIDLEKYLIKRARLERDDGSYLSPDKRIEVACNKVTEEEILKSEEELEKLRASREIIGCRCLPPMFKTVPELKQILKDFGATGYSSMRKGDLILAVEKIKGKSCCLPNSGCECVDNTISCYSESCLCLSAGSGKRLCRNKFGKKMFQQPRAFKSRKTTKILKAWDTFYTPETDRTFSYKKKLLKQHATIT